MVYPIQIAQFRYACETGVYLQLYMDLCAWALCVGSPNPLPPNTPFPVASPRHYASRCGGAGTWHMAHPFSARCFIITRCIDVFPCVSFFFCTATSAAAAAASFEFIYTHANILRNRTQTRHGVLIPATPIHTRIQWALRARQSRDYILLLISVASHRPGRVRWRWGALGGSRAAGFGDVCVFCVYVS